MIHPNTVGDVRFRQFFFWSIRSTFFTFRPLQYSIHILSLGNLQCDHIYAKLLCFACEQLGSPPTTSTTLPLSLWQICRYPYRADHLISSDFIWGRIPRSWAMDIPSDYPSELGERIYMIGRFPWPVPICSIFQPWLACYLTPWRGFQGLNVG